MVSWIKVLLKNLKFMLTIMFRKIKFIYIFFFFQHLCHKIIVVEIERLRVD